MLMQYPCHKLHNDVFCLECNFNTIVEIMAAVGAYQPPFLYLVNIAISTKSGENSIKP